MTERALGTLARADKGPVKPPPALDGPLRTVADAIAGWPGVIATVHWDLFHPSRVDGIDFYFGEEELGHIHLDGALHLATSPSLGKALIAERLARPFHYQRGWVCEDVQTIGPAAAIALFRRNYERLRRAN
ncbi:luciferase family protein [Methylocapsa sp. S129]|uniref:luciferase domain-containing protein n=1 Tax=Methylocapsa sp. S129 TaxID=1641869 RepID=UPI00131AF741|nr:luciferase family protein [Methylocapsa sp. S129]